MSTVHAKCVTLWYVGRDGWGGPLVLRSRKMLEMDKDFRKVRDGSCGAIVVNKGDDGAPLFPWRRSPAEAVAAYRERLEADAAALRDRLRCIERSVGEALALLSVEELAAAGKEG